MCDDEPDDEPDDDDDDVQFVDIAPPPLAPAPAGGPAWNAAMAPALAEVSAPWRRFFLSTQELAAGMCASVVHIDYAQVSALSSKGNGGGDKRGKASEAALEAAYPVGGAVLGGGKAKRGKGTAPSPSPGKARWITVNGTEKVYVTADGTEKKGSDAFRAYQRDKEAAGAGGASAAPSPSPPSAKPAKRRKGGWTAVRRKRKRGS